MRPALAGLLSLLCLAGCSDYAFTAEKGGASGMITPDRDAPDDGEDADSSAPEDTGGPPVPETCEEASPGRLSPPAVDPSCLVEDGWGLFEPVVEWQWSSNDVNPGFDQVMATPVVGNLNDDNGDGVVDENDVPDIVFTSFSRSNYRNAGTLTAISGDGSGTLWSILDAGGHRPFGSGGVAIGDLEGDGLPDVCVASPDATVLCLEGDGSFKWAAGSTTYLTGNPAIADMDGSGSAEVAMGSWVFSSSGTVLLGESGCSGGSGNSFAVDMDGDGELELVAGCEVRELDGSTLWTSARPDGIPAVGDFDADGAPEVVRSAGGQLILTDSDGTDLWSVAIPGGGSGGAPTVADYDGDGAPEVGVAALYYYTVFDTDGTVLWSNPTNDTSSSRTGSSVFDFDRDGAAEVVYADQFNLFVYDGPTGLVRMELDGHANGTLLEYPVVADVDNDGSTEIVLASNNYAYSGWNGITVIGDETGTWAAARPIWNQFAYHITNVEADGGIPRSPRENWTTWNTFRAGGTELGPSDWLADLRPGPLEVCVETCAEDTVRIWVGVSNHGLLDANASVGGLSRAGESELLVEVSVPPVAAGDAVWAGPFDLHRDDWGVGQLAFRADVERTVEECEDDNNTLSLGEWPCD